MNTQLKNIGILIANARKAKGMTQDELGAAVGIGKAMVSKVENGNCINFNTINRLTEALGLEPMVELKPKGAADKNLIEYITAAIIEFARRYSLTIREASNYLNRFKDLDFLSEFYDVEHTLSFNDCVDDLTLVCIKNGGEIR